MKLLHSVAGENRTKVLLTLLHLWEKNGRATVREVASGAGLSLEPTLIHLRGLKAEGLVAWDEGSRGTLRPLVEVVR